MKTRFIPGLVFYFFLVNSLASCVVTGPRVPLITIEDQSAVISPVILGTCSFFMKIKNEGMGEDALIGARIDMSGAVSELHDVRDGKMTRIEKIRIPPKSTVDLKPGSLHIMFFKMPKDIKEGSEFTLFLKFEKSGEKQVRVKLQKRVRP